MFNNAFICEVVQILLFVVVEDFEVLLQISKIPFNILQAPMALSPGFIVGREKVLQLHHYFLNLAKHELVLSLHNNYLLPRITENHQSRTIFDELMRGPVRDIIFTKSSIKS